MQNNSYRLYCKFEGQSQFKPLDLSRGQQVTNLIYATIFTDAELEAVKRTIEMNKETKFEIRKIKP